jgi:hypothetical protein
MELERKESKYGMDGIEQKSPKIGCMESKFRSS